MSKSKLLKSIYCITHVDFSRNWSSFAKNHFDVHLYLGTRESVLKPTNDDDAIPWYHQIWFKFKEVFFCCFDEDGDYKLRKKKTKTKTEDIEVCSCSTFQLFLNCLFLSVCKKHNIYLYLEANISPGMSRFFPRFLF